MSEATTEATAEATAFFSVILQHIGLVLGALSRGLASIPWSLVFSHLASLVVLPLKALLIPARVLARVLFVISTPVLYPLSYLFAGIAALLRLVASLEVRLPTSYCKMLPLTDRLNPLAAIYFCKYLTTRRRPQLRPPFPPSLEGN